MMSRNLDLFPGTCIHLVKKEFRFKLNIPMGEEIYNKLLGEIKQFQLKLILYNCICVAKKIMTVGEMSPSNVCWFIWRRNKEGRELLNWWCWFGGSGREKGKLTSSLYTWHTFNLPTQAYILSVMTNLPRRTDLSSKGGHFRLQEYWGRMSSMTASVDGYAQAVPQDGLGPLWED